MSSGYLLHHPFYIKELLEHLDKEIQEHFF